MVDTNPSMAEDTSMAEDGVPTECVPIPSGPPPLPFLGNLRDLTGPDGGLHEHIPRLVSEYGGLFSLQIPSGLINLPTAKFGGTVVLADPELLGEMFQRPDVFQKRLFKHSAIRQGLGGQGLFTTDDDEPIHDQAARVLLPAFSMKGMQEYFEMIKETTAVLQQQFIEQGAAGAAVDLHPLLSRYTFDIIGKVGFGRDFSSLTGRPCSFLDRFQEFSESSLRLQQGIGGFSGAFKTSKAVAGLVTGELATSKRIVSEIEAEVKAVIADKKSLVAGEGGCPFKRAAPAPAPSEAEIDPAAAGGCPFAKKGIVKDMATRMLTEPDPETGELLPDDNIVNQAATFLIAGHDSTSTAITMLLYHVALSPDVEERVYNEVMSVVGDGPITWDALGKMKYCTQVVKENLRLFSPAAQFVKTSPPDQTVTLGRYVVPPGTSFVCSTWGLHRNPDVYPDPLKFDPDRWSDENAAKRSPYAWLPFSYGKRGCIGQQLSLIEQRVCLASLVRKFHFRVDLSTKLEVTAPLFLDPQGIFLKCVPRAEPVERPLPSVLPAAATASSQPTDVGEVEALKGKRLVVLFGSNMGSAEDFADRALTTGKGFGMVAEKHSLDKLVTAKVVLPKGEDGLVIVVTSVYNGQPPDNARRFAAWLDTLDAAAAVEGVRFAVFGCGNKQWAATYMQFPRTVSETLESLGGLPMVPMGKGDMDSGEAELSFTRWQVSLVVALLQAHGAPIPDGIKETLYPKPPVYSIFRKVDAKAEEIPVATLEANLQEAKRQALRTFLAGNQAFIAEVSCNRELLAAPDRSTRHIEVALPDGVSYAAGDHLGVVGGNPDEVVFAYMDRLGLARDAVVRIELEEGSSSSTVPLARNVAAYAVLAYHFELQQLASRAQLYALSKLACEPAEAEHLRTLADFGRDNSGEVQGGCPDAFERYVLQSRRTLLEVLQEHPSVKASAGAVLGMLPPMKPRYYSISSSPKHSPGVATVSVSVVQGTSPTGRRHLGLCSNYLKAQACQKSFPPSVMPSLPGGPSGKGMPLFTFVKDTGSSFRLPQSDAPVIMVGPGTGVAPMRGFIQDRVADGRRENVLFFGCRDESDYLYKDELQAWEAEGSLKLFVAFSRKEGTPKTYVQSLIAQESALVVELVKKGAHVYVCGDASKMAPDVKATVARLLSEAGHGEDCVDRMAAEGRYCEDVWAAQSF